MVKTYIYILLTIVIIVISIIINLYFINDDNLLYKKMSIINDQIASNSKNQNINLHYIEKKYLYFSIINKEENEFGNTECIIIYDLEKNETKNIEFTDNIRIINFTIFDDYIFYITIERENSNIVWKLNKSDLKFSKKTILKEGIIKNPLLSPEIKKIENKLYFFSLNETVDINEYSFYILDNDNLILLLTIDGNREKIFDLEKVYVRYNKIYYISSYKNEQSLNEFNPETKEKKVVYSVEDSNEFIFEFELLNNAIIINSIKNNKSCLIFQYLHKNRNIFNSNITLSFIKKINEDNVLTHNEDGTFKIFNINGKKTKTFRFKNLNLYPKYEIYNSKFLIFQTFDNNFYIHEL